MVHTGLWPAPISRPPPCPIKFPGKFSEPKTDPSPLICVGTRRKIFQDKKGRFFVQGRALTFLCRDMTQSKRAAVVVSVLALVEREVVNPGQP